MAAKESENSPDDGPKKGENVVDPKEVRQESAKAAQSAMALKKKARKLREAATAAGDPEERQKLMEEAIDRECEAESFGKWAKYLRSGTFQGMAAGTGLGVMPGVTLGALTGTLVGGVTSLITGALGAGVGAAVGALHGPFFNVGEVAGKGIQKVTGNLPGWVATDKQKRTLEKMMGQVKDEEMPDEGELTDMMADWDEDAIEPGSWTETAVNVASPFMDEKNPKQEAADTRSALMEASKQKPKSQGTKQTDGPRRGPPRQSKGSASNNQGTQSSTQAASAKTKPSGDDKRQPSAEGPQGSSQSQTRKKPRKLESRSPNSSTTSKDKTNDAKENIAPNQAQKSAGEKKKPKKLEVRGK